MTTTNNTIAGTTTASTVADLTNTNYHRSITVINRSTASSPIELWLTTDGTNPTVAGANCYLVLAAQSRRFENSMAPVEPGLPSSGGSTPLKVISSSNCAYAVEYN